MHTGLSCKYYYTVLSNWIYFLLIEVKILYWYSKHSVGKLIRILYLYNTFYTLFELEETSSLFELLWSSTTNLSVVTRSGHEFFCYQFCRLIVCNKISDNGRETLLFLPCPIVWTAWGLRKLIKQLQPISFAKQSCSPDEKHIIGKESPHNPRILFVNILKTA